MSLPKSNLQKIIQVSCAIIVSEDNKILVTQRSSIMSLPLKWEFPGGKIEKEESPEQTIFREIKEDSAILDKKCIPLDLRCKSKNYHHNRNRI
jgi:mutator protein MutT